MDESIVLACSQCHASCRVPSEFAGRQVRCPRCKACFVVPKPSPVIASSAGDDDILRWLDETLPEDATVSGLNHLEQEEDRQTEAIHEPTHPASSEIFHRLNLHRTDGTRATFWVPADIVADPAFRASMPQVCCSCLATTGLRIYLMSSDQNLKTLDERFASAVYCPVARLDELPRVSAEELLAYLPDNGYDQPPFNLPFPYYCCDNCSPVGIVQASVTGSGDERRGWISISNLEVACRFFANNRGTDDNDYHKLKIHCRIRRENRFDKLAVPVRAELMRWYRPHANEHFITFLPDVENRKAVDGSVGLIITDVRLIFRHDPALRVFPLSESFTITTHLAMGGTMSDVRVEIYSATHGRATVTLDKESWANLKHYLKGLEAHVKFIG